MSESSFTLFAQAPTWDGVEANGQQKRHPERWSLAIGLLHDQRWMHQKATPDERAVLHTYLITLARNTSARFVVRLEAIDYARSAGLATIQEARHHLTLLLRDLELTNPSLSDLLTLTNWLAQRSLFDEPLSHGIAGAGILQLDQDDRKRFLQSLQEETVRIGVETEGSIAFCIVAAFEATARSLTGNARPDILSPAHKEHSLGTVRIAKALMDLRDISLPWLVRSAIKIDLSLCQRLIEVAFTLWPPTPQRDSIAAERTLVEERRTCASALFGAIIALPGGTPYITAALDAGLRNDGATLALLEACVAAGDRPLYGRIANKLLSEKPHLAASLVPPDLPPAIMVARLRMLLSTLNTESASAALATLRTLALQRARETAGDAPEGTATLLQVLYRQLVETNDPLSAQVLQLLYGIYTRFIRDVQGDGSSGIHSLTVNNALLPVLIEWSDERVRRSLEEASEDENSALHAAEVLREQLSAAHADKVVTQRALDELRMLSRKEATQDSVEGRLPVLRQLTALCDAIDRTLAAKQGDYDSLMWAEEAIFDILAAHGIRPQGSTGERTQFDAALHEYVGARGGDHEWYEVLESGYVLETSGEKIVLKRIPVRPLTT